MTSERVDGLTNELTVDDKTKMSNALDNMDDNNPDTNEMNETDDMKQAPHRSAKNSDTRYRYKRKSTLEVQKEMLETFSDRTPMNIIRYILFGGPPPYAEDDPRRHPTYRYLAEERESKKKGDSM